MRGNQPPSLFIDPEKRYRSFNRYLREQFGCKVYKVSLDAGFTCPNRDGKLGHSGCIFCSPRGSASPLVDPKASIDQQMRAGIAFGQRRYRAKGFLAYFQAFTNTYAPLEHLKRLYDVALQHHEVVGLSVGTRPDCITDEVLNLLQGYSRTHEVWIEYGLQSVHDYTLEWLQRGHNAAAFFDAIERTRDRGLRICAHVIFGLPTETVEDMLTTIRALIPLPLDGIKIHALHVVQGTQLAAMYAAENLGFLSQADYVQIVCDALELLPSHIVIQRLTGEAPASELVGPEWTLRKVETLQAITAELRKRGTWQGIRDPSSA